MNKSILAVTAAVLSASAWATVSNVEGGAIPATNAVSAKIFSTLPICRRVDAPAFVRRPGGDWEAAEEGKFYPFGSSYRADKGGKLVLSFGRGLTVKVADGSEFGTRNQKIGEKTRTIVLSRGTVDLKLPDNLPEGAFFVTAPAFTVAYASQETVTNSGFVIKNPAGESRITYEDKGDGDVATIRCVTGALCVEGQHFTIPSMRAANEVKIRSSRDHLSTVLYGTSGDFVVEVDQGIRNQEEFDDEGKVSISAQKQKLDWHLTPATKIIINRMLPAIGKRMSVHTMAFDASGARKSECVFCEGLASVNSGEIVPKERLNEGEELAKRDAEMTETTSADVDDVKSVEPAEKDADSTDSED